MTIMPGFFISVLIIVLIVGLVILSRRLKHLHHELNKANAEIEKSRKEISAQVLARTATIRKVNEDLQYEMAKRMRSEQRLLQEVELLRSSISGAPIVLWAIDGNGVFILTEGKGLAALGLKSGGGVGKSVFDVFKDEQQILENCKTALAGESVKTCIKSSGRVYESWFRPVRSANGEVAGTIVLVVDRDEEADNKKYAVSIGRQEEQTNRV